MERFKQKANLSPVIQASEIWTSKEAVLWIHYLNPLEKSWDFSFWCQIDPLNNNEISYAQLNNSLEEKSECF